MVKFVKTPGDDDKINIPLVDPLYKDMIECETLLDSTGSQFARRCYFRSAFALMEGYIFWIRNMALQTLVNRIGHHDEIPMHKIVLLMDEVARPDATGVISKDSARIPFTNDTAFVLRTYSEALGVDPTTLFSDNGWSELKKSLKARHRITHPKDPRDLDISDDEMWSLRLGITWIMNSLPTIIKQSRVDDCGDDASAIE